MGNKIYLFKRSIRIGPQIQLLKNISPIEIATQTIPIQTMQSNRYQRSFGCQQSSEVSLDKQVASPEVDESSDNKPVAKPPRYNELVRSKFPLGMHKNGKLFQYNFWAPETKITMNDFVEAHSIPIYDLKNKANFSKYCKDRGWYNTASHFSRVRTSVHTSNARLICGIKSKFDVSIQVSDCFLHRDGTVMRAYGIIGGNLTAVSRAFSYLCDSWRPTFFRETRWHHDSIFYCESEFPPIKRPLNRDVCDDFYARLQMIPECSSGDKNNVNIDSKFNSNSNCLILTLPKDCKFNQKIIHQYHLQYEIKNNDRFQVIIIKASTSSELSELKQNLERHLQDCYTLSEKLIQI